MPNFLVIGAAKSGTTALHNYLSQHPHMGRGNPAALLEWEETKFLWRAPDVRRQLIEVYREDIRELQDMLGNDLDHWLA